MNCALFVNCTDCREILGQALETKAVQFKLPGLQAFELELGLATAVRALNTCCIFFCGICLVLLRIFCMKSLQTFCFCFWGPCLFYLIHDPPQCQNKNEAM